MLAAYDDWAAKSIASVLMMMIFIMMDVGGANENCGSKQYHSCKTGLRFKSDFWWLTPFSPLLV
jgi:hypothetical protein